MVQAAGGRKARFRVIFGSSFLLVVVTAACAVSEQPVSTDDSNKKAILNGVVQVEKSSGNHYSASISLQNLQYNQVVSAKSQCEGAIGSVVPAFADQCLINTALTPLNLILEGTAKALGAKDFLSHADLPNIQNVWVQQLSNNDCWAATLEMARRYLGLKDISREQIWRAGTKLCPAISRQATGATAYQISYVILNYLQPMDGSTTNSQVCNGGNCVVDALSTGHPVILLRAGHAVLIIGADYFRDNNGVDIVRRLRVLDPAAPNGTPKIVSQLELCTPTTMIEY